MRRARSASIYDSLRIEVGRNGAIKSPTPQDERAAAANSFYAGMDTSGIGQADTGARSSRTFTAGDLMPQGYLNRQPAGFDTQAVEVGKHENARAALPNRTGGAGGGASKPQRYRPDRRRPRTPLAKRR